MTVLAFAPKHNSHGKHDATGAFHPCARGYTKMHGGEVVLFDNHEPMPNRAAEVLAAIDTYHSREKLVSVAFFCHGWVNGIQAGFDLRPGMRRGRPPVALADALAKRCGTGLILPLYACSTAGGPDLPTGEAAPGGDGGFADELRDALWRAGVTNCRVDAHDRKGHTTRNPYVRRFEGKAATGGAWLIRPKSAQWRNWKVQLRNREDELHLLFPFLDRRAVLAHIGHPALGKSLGHAIPDED